MPLLAIIFGGIMFGVGMVLTRGCISRLVVLTGTGNIRAFIVFIVFAITAHATLKGIFAPIRVWLGSFTLNLVFIGLLVPLSYLGTGFILFDEFDPIQLESLSFTSPSSDLLFWTIASSAIPAGFGVGLLGGVLLGSFISAITRNEFKWITFENQQQTKQYLIGASLMGSGGVLAGGCTVGAGLSGVP